MAAGAAHIVFGALVGPASFGLARQNVQVITDAPARKAAQIAPTRVARTGVQNPTCCTD